MRCPEYIKVVIALWDEGLEMKATEYRPVAMTPGRCQKAMGVCVWQRPEHAAAGGGIVCASPDLKPALWSMDEPAMSYFMQECPACKHKWVFSHRNKFCKNKACSNKRPWSLLTVDRCRYYVRTPAQKGDMRAAKRKAVAYSADRIRAQHKGPRPAVYAELRACMVELAASQHGFELGARAYVRLAAIASRRAEQRHGRIARATAELRRAA